MSRWTTALAVTVSLLVGISAPAAWSAHLDHSVSFDESDLTVSKWREFDVISLRGCDLTREIGLPQLPVLPLTIALPAGAHATGLEVLEAESSELLERFTPLPAQHPRILPVPGLDIPARPFVKANPFVYEGEVPYPGSIAKLLSRGSLDGDQLVGVAVHPVQFIPAAGKVRFFNSVTIRVHYDLGESPPRAVRPARSDITGILSGNQPPVRSDVQQPRTLSRELPDGDYEHVIVSGRVEFESAFAPLAEWKTEKGVPSTVVPLSWIEATYPGVDTQERIRSFIADAHATWGSVWFLLAGDTQWIPARRAYAMTCEAGGHEDEDAIGCDMYYANLDGSWNADGDETYGELADDVDLYPEVFVGRAPVVSPEEADAFVAKLLAYEKAQPDDFQLEMLMAAEVLWTDPFTDSGIALNRIDRESVPPRYDPINKLYETLGNESVESVKAALNAGVGHFLHSGHAWVNAMGCGDGYLYRWEVAELANGSRQPLIYSIGCWPAAFDLTEACMAERFLQDPDGGAVAFIGNSRYGWASPGNPGYGYSERFMQEFYRVLFVDGVTSAGAALAAAKAAFVPFSQTENVYRWHQYELNLLGDPEMPVWTDEPKPLAVTYPDSVVPGPSVLSVSVRTSGGPVEGARVCASNGSDVYERGLTASDGAVVLSVDTVLPDSLSVTVTAPDCFPHRGRIPVVFSGAFLRAVGTDVDDSAGGNGDGVAGPGETVDLAVELRNFGTADAREVEATLSSADAMVSVLSDRADYGDVGGGASATGTPAFTVVVSPDCDDGHVAMLDLSITGAGDRSAWSGSFPLTVGAPVLGLASYSVDDEWGGDGDGFVEPGETVKLMVEVANAGSADAHSPSFSLSTDAPEMDVTEPTASLPAIPAGESGQVVFTVAVAPECPPNAFPSFELHAITVDGFESTGTLLMTVGSAGFSHDFESGASGWTHGGPADVWGLTDHRTHSGSSAWYAGTEGLWQYTNNADASLDSPDFLRGAGSELSFWCWYEFPIYHEDGFFVEILSSGTVMDTLDFIGSGGALDILGTIGNDWLEYRYQLPGEAGDTLQIRFRFSSDDADVAEGVYIDDVSVVATDMPTNTGAGGEGAELPRPILHQNHPNPFSPSTSINYSLMAAGVVELTIYNIQGRLIRTLVSDTQPPGEYEVTWDGTDDYGIDVAAGVYLYRLRQEEAEDTRKMILVR